MALNDALALSGVTATGRVLAGPNPSLLAIDDNGVLQRTRDGAHSSLVVKIPGHMVVGETTETVAGELVDGSIVAQRAYLGDAIDILTAVPSNPALVVARNLNGSTALMVAGRFITRIVPTNIATVASEYYGIASYLSSKGVTAGTFSSTTLRAGHFSALHDAPVNLSVAVGVNGVGGSESTGTGAITSATGVRAQLEHAGSGTVTVGRAITCATPVISNGSVTTYYGIDVFGTSSTRVTTAAGIHVQAFATSGTNRGIWFDSNTAGTGAGIVFGTAGDTSLWRGASNQLLTQGDWSARHYLCSSVPSIAAGAGAGTAPTLTLDRHTDQGFRVTLVQGNPTNTGVIFTLTFGASFAVAPACTFSPSNATAAELATTSCPYVTTTTTTVVFNSGSVGLVAGSTYIWLFTVR